MRILHKFLKLIDRYLLTKLYLQHSDILKFRKYHKCVKRLTKRKFTVIFKKRNDWDKRHLELNYSVLLKNSIDLFSLLSTLAILSDLYGWELIDYDERLLDGDKILFDSFQDPECTLPFYTW